MVAAFHDIRLWERVEAYDAPTVVQRYGEKEGVSLEEARRLFRETKRFLYLCAVLPFSCSPSRAIDRMWHRFIEDTREYMAFCGTCFGTFLHHVPLTGPSPDDYLRVRGAAASVFGTLDLTAWPTADAQSVADCKDDSGCKDAKEDAWDIMPHHPREYLDITVGVA